PSRLPSLPCTGPPPSPIPTLSLHDALPTFPALELIAAGAAHVPDRHLARAVVLPDEVRRSVAVEVAGRDDGPAGDAGHREPVPRDRKSTRLNSSHLVISYAVFCLKKKKHEG